MRESLHMMYSPLYMQHDLCHRLSVSRSSIARPGSEPCVSPRPLTIQLHEAIHQAQLTHTPPLLHVCDLASPACCLRQRRRETAAFGWASATSAPRASVVFWTRSWVALSATGAAKGRAGSV